MYIYVHALGTVKAGATLRDAPLQLDNESPFALRGRAIRTPITLTSGGAPSVQSILSRFRDPLGNYVASDLMPASADLGDSFGGRGGRPGLVYPEYVYPAGAVINTDVKNSGASDTDVTIYYFGVRLLPEGWGNLRSYPPKFSLIPYHKQVTATNLGLTETRHDVIMVNTSADADLVLRSGQCGNNQNFPNFPIAFNRFHNVLVTMADETRKPYMSAPVDTAYLFGAANPNGPNAPGNAVPGLLVPEIWMRPNCIMYFDFYRQDSAFVGHNGEVAQDVQIAFNGSKVILK